MGTARDIIIRVRGAVLDTAAMTRMAGRGLRVGGRSGVLRPLERRRVGCWGMNWDMDRWLRWRGWLQALTALTNSSANTKSTRYVHGMLRFVLYRTWVLKYHFGTTSGYSPPNLLHNTNFIPEDHTNIKLRRKSAWNVAKTPIAHAAPTIAAAPAEESWMG